MTAGSTAATAQADGVQEDLVGEALPGVGLEDLGVAQAVGQPAGWQDDRPDHHGTGETAPADLVDAGDEPVAEVPVVLFHR